MQPLHYFSCPVDRCRRGAGQGCSQAGSHCRLVGVWRMGRKTTNFDPSILRFLRYRRVEREDRGKNLQAGGLDAEIVENQPLVGIIERSCEWRMIS
jgi:hypothetical protein